MPKYLVGKSHNYRQYLYEALKVMYQAGIVYFTLDDLASWSGLPVTVSMRKYCDYLALEGSLIVAAPQMVADRRGRMYNLNSLAWFGVVPPA